jgi:thioredoxin 1
MSASTNHLIEAAADTFDDLINRDTPTLVDFWAPWCGPCRALTPTIEQLAQDAGDRATIAKLNVDDHPTIAARYGISSIPSVLVFRKGELIETLVGLRPKDAYEDALGL